MQQLPKQLRLVLDVSGSMYRFNGLDGRLERVMEAACLVMEAFDKYEHRFKVNDMVDQLRAQGKGAIFEVFFQNCINNFNASKLCPRFC